MRDTAEANKRNRTHTAEIKRTSPKIGTTRQEAWRMLSDITSMTEWAPGVTKVEIKPNGGKKTGTVRTVVFADGRNVEEEIITWQEGRKFSYTATDGLPFSLYIAALSINDEYGDHISITWESNLRGDNMTKERFDTQVTEMGKFYEESLANLKRILE